MIRSSKQYEQRAHEQPTQATQWAQQNAEQDGGGGMGFDTRQLMRSAAAGEAPWHHSYSATGAARVNVPDAPESSAKGQPLPPPSPSGVSVWGTIIAPPDSAAYRSMISPLQGPELPYSHGLRTDDVRTERLNMRAAKPGGSDERYFKRTGYAPGHRPDGGNG